MLLSIYTSLISEPDDIEFFEYLYTRYKYVLIHDAYLIIKDQHYAQDIVHDAFIKIAKNIDKIDFGDNPLPILRTVTRNCSFNLYNKLKNEKNVYNIDDQLSIPDSTDLVSNAENKSDVEFIADFVESMPHCYADIFTLRYVNDLSCIQIASLLDIKASTVRKRLQRIRDAIEEKLSKGDKL